MISCLERKNLSIDENTWKMQLCRVMFTSGSEWPAGPEAAADDVANARYSAREGDLRSATKKTSIATT